jgi:hypothetical protein
MSNRFMISVAALALIAGTGLANAQGTMKNDSGGAGAQPTQHSQPSGGAAEHGTMGKESASPQKGTVGQAGGSSTMKSGAASEEKSSGAMKDERSGREMNKNAAEDKSGAAKGHDEHAQGQMDKSQQDKSKSMSQDTTKSGSKEMKAEGREGRDSNQKAEGSKTGTSTSTNKAETRQGNETRTNQNAQGEANSRTTVGQAGAGAKLSTEQRTQITSVIRDEHVRSVDNVNFSISVGTRVPREGVEFHTLPSRVVTIYPEWRDYRYILVHNQIVIVDPNTYEIVAVLDV